MLLPKFGRPVRAAGWLIALALGFGVGEARAGRGIIITDTTLMPVGDPLTQYDFKLSLVLGNQILQGDNITLLNIANYDGNSRYIFSSGGIDYSRFFSIVPTPGSLAGTTNLELILTASPGSLTNLTSGDLPIGDLIVETNVEFPPSSNSPLLDPINYTTQTHLFPSGVLNIGAGVTARPGIVPEPSSLIMLGLSLVVGSTAGAMARGRCAWAWPRDQAG